MIIFQALNNIFIVFRRDANLMASLTWFALFTIFSCLFGFRPIVYVVFSTVVVKHVVVLAGVHTQSHSIRGTASLAPVLSDQTTSNSSH